MIKEAKEAIERVATGLRNMGIKPDYFLFCGEDDWTWDKEDICGIPVLHSKFIHNLTTDEGVLFIPLWRLEGDYLTEICNFNRGYTG